MNALAEHLPEIDARLEREIYAYLGFMDVARDEDTLWLEYQAWKHITDKRRTLRERIADYSIQREQGV